MTESPRQENDSDRRERRQRGSRRQTFGVVLTVLGIFAAIIGRGPVPADVAAIADVRLAYKIGMYGLPGILIIGGIISIIRGGSWMR